MFTDNNVDTPAAKILREAGHPGAIKAPDVNAVNAEAGVVTIAPDASIITPTPVVAPSPVTEPAAATDTGVVGSAAPENVVTTDPGVVTNATAAVAEPAPAPVTTTGTQSATELNDDAVRKYLKEKRGIDVSSLEDLKQKPALTPEEQAAAEERRRNEAIAYALDKQIVSRKDLESYAADNARNPRDTALQIFSNHLKSQGVSDEDIADRFNEFFYESEPDGHPLKEMQKAQMQTIHDNYIAAKYGKILGADEAYASHIQDTNDATDYGKRVSTVFQGMDKGYEMKFPVGDKEYVFKVKEDVIAEIKNNYQTEDMFETLRGRVKDAETLKGMVEASIIQRELPKILAEVAESHRQAGILEHEAKLAAVPQTKLAGGTPEHQTVVTGLSGPAAALLQATRN